MCNNTVTIVEYRHQLLVPTA
eukprot:COSAG02_NODE_35021_length_475_cov_0.688830_2_plen_20_part_01